MFCYFFFYSKGLSRSISFALDKDKDRGRRRANVDPSIYEDTLPRNTGADYQRIPPRRQGSLSPKRVTMTPPPSSSINTNRKQGVISNSSIPIQHSLRFGASPGAAPRIPIINSMSSSSSVPAGLNQVGKKVQVSFKINTTYSQHHRPIHN